MPPVLILVPRGIHRRLWKGSFRGREGPFTLTRGHVWRKLQDIYNPKGFTTEFLTFRKIFDTSLEHFDSVEEYLHKVTVLVDDLEGKEITLSPQLVMSWVLYHLGEEYDGFVTNIIQSPRNNPNAYNVETLFSTLLDGV